MVSRGISASQAEEDQKVRFDSFGSILRPSENYGVNYGPWFKKLPLVTLEGGERVLVELKSAAAVRKYKTAFTERNTSILPFRCLLSGSHLCHLRLKTDPPPSSPLVTSRSAIPGQSTDSRAATGVWTFWDPC